MKPKLESTYICVENLDRAKTFYEWFLDRKGIHKGNHIEVFSRRYFNEKPI